MTPGVYYQEMDLSQYIRQLSDTSLGLVITAPKGPVDEKVLCTSVKDFENKFGVATDTHPGMLVAREFLEAGGNALWVVRVANNPVVATATITCIDGVAEIELSGKGSGSDYNKLSFAISHTTQKSQSKSTAHNLIAVASQQFTITADHKPLVPGTVSIKFGGVQVATDDSAGALVFSAQSSTYSGTVNYKTGVITITAANVGAPVTVNAVTVSHYFSAFTFQTILTVKNAANKVIRRKEVETYYGCTVANMVETLADSSYIAAISPAPTVFPDAGVYQMTGGTDGITGLTDAHYIGDTLGGSATGLQIFASNVDVNEVMVPGVTTAGVRQALIQLAEARQDIMVPLDTPSDATVETAADWADATGAYSAYGVIDANVASIYFPHYTATNHNTGDVDLMPPTAAIAQVLARSDWWQAPAGPDQGKLRNCLDTSVHLSVGDRQFLAQHRINPIGTLAGLGIQVLGQQTATLTASALDRVGAKRALLRIEKSITTALYPLLFKPNNEFTWAEAEGLIQPYLDSLTAQGRIYGGKFYCNEKTNTAQVVNNNTMSCVCILSLLKFAERIVVTFEVTEYGVVITEALISNNIVGL
jgi:phage tail sheath protein FI